MLIAPGLIGGLGGELLGGKLCQVPRGQLEVLAANFSGKQFDKSRGALGAGLAANVSGVDFAKQSEANGGTWQRISQEKNAKCPRASGRAEQQTVLGEMLLSILTSLGGLGSDFFFGEAIC